MELLYGILVISLLSVFLISNITKTRKRSYDENERILDELNSQVELKQNTLLAIEQTIKNKIIDKSVSLTNIEIKSLDVYDKTNIKIPVDIIEDLHSLNLETEKEILDYIENQRYFWKLENTKKPYRR